MAVSDTFTTFEDFEVAFLIPFWGEVHQGRVRCRLYEERYDKLKGLSMADHYLKFAVLAKSLRPPTPQTELFAALRCHYEAYIQRVWLTAQIRTVSDAITFLKQCRI
jgi:hypothetical protein